MNKINIVFIGCVQFSRTVLIELLNQNVNITGICTKKKNIFNADFSDLSDLAKAKNIPYIFWKNKCDKEMYSWIKRKKPDFIFCIGWSNIISKKILNLAKYYSIGYHPLDINKYKGRHPIIWAIILGLKKISPTFFVMSKFADTGKILSQKNFVLKSSHNSSYVYGKLKLVAKEQVSDVIKKIIKNKNKIKFNHSELKKKFNEGFFLRKRSFNDGQIDWRMSAKSIQRLINALSKPYSYASFTYGGKNFKVKSVKIVRTKVKEEPGKVILLKGKKPIIRTGENAIKLIDIYPKKSFKLNEYLK